MDPVNQPQLPPEPPQAEAGAPSASQPLPAQPLGPNARPTVSPLVLSYASPLTGALVPIRAFSTSLEANVARLKLESEGIAANVVGVDSSSIGIPLGFGAIKLLVCAADEAPARRILDEIDRRRARRMAAGRQSQLCPRCNGPSRGFGPARLAAGLVLLALAFVTFSMDALSGSGALAGMAMSVCGIYCLVSAFWRRRCTSCGHVWTPSTSADDDDSPGNGSS